MFFRNALIGNEGFFSLPAFPTVLTCHPYDKVSKHGMRVRGYICDVCSIAKYDISYSFSIHMLTEILILAEPACTIRKVMLLPSRHIYFNGLTPAFATIWTIVPIFNISDSHMACLIRGSIGFSPEPVFLFHIFMTADSNLYLLLRSTTVLTKSILKTMPVLLVDQRNFFFLFLTTGHTLVIAHRLSAHGMKDAVDWRVFQRFTVFKTIQMGFFVGTIEYISAVPTTFGKHFHFMRAAHCVRLCCRYINPFSGTVAAIVLHRNFANKGMTIFINVCVIAVQNFPMPIRILMLAFRIRRYELRNLFQFDGFLCGLVGVGFLNSFAPGYVISFIIGFAISVVSGFRFRIIRRFGFRFLRRVFLLVPYRSFFIVFGFRFRIRFGRRFPVCVLSRFRFFRFHGLNGLHRRAVSVALRCNCAAAKHQYKCKRQRQEPQQ